MGGNVKVATLIERLRERTIVVGGVTSDLLLEAAATLEAAREDACVALVADIRFACGDNGKRMQPELVEFVRELAGDAARYRHLRSNESNGSVDLCVCRVEWGHKSGGRTQYELLTEEHADAAIDQARGKGDGGNG